MSLKTLTIAGALALLSLGQAVAAPVGTQATDKTEGFAIMAGRATGAGVLQPGSGGIETVTRLAAGIYDVKFARSVKDCTVTGVLTGAYGHMVPTATATDDIVRVYTSNSVPALGDYNFAIQAICY